MAETTVQTNNKMIQFRKDIIKEYFRESDFSAYSGDGPQNIIHTMMDPKQGGEQINIPLIENLKGSGVGSGPLAGNEEAIDDYGCRMWVDWARNAVAAKKSERQKESAKIFDRAQPLLSEWGKDLQRDEIIAALLSLPSESPPVNLGSDAGDRVNGIRFEDSTAAQQDAWLTANADRALFGRNEGNLSAGDLSASLANVDSADTLNGASLVKLKGLARSASPKIAPVRVREAQNRAYYTAFCGTRIFNDLAEDLKETPNATARPRDVGQNPLFQDGDLLYRGVIVREFPEIDEFTDNTWTQLQTAGASSIKLNPIFLCGRSAIGMPWGQMPQPTMRKEDDYGFIKGVGIDMCYGVGKIFKKSPKSGTNLKQWGIVTGFFAETTQ